ncbi:MAG: 50S ribosomal protein L10 [Akkermansia sp.]
MNPDKRIIIDDLTARVNASPFLIVVDYTAITVPEFTNLRSALAASGAQCHVAKNNFMRTALTDAGLPTLGNTSSARPPSSPEHPTWLAPPKPSIPSTRLPRRPNTR